MLKQTKLFPFVFVALVQICSSQSTLKLLDRISYDVTDAIKVGEAIVVASSNNLELWLSIDGKWERHSRLQIAELNTRIETIEYYDGCLFVATNDGYVAIAQDSLHTLVLRCRTRVAIENYCSLFLTRQGVFVAGGHIMAKVAYIAGGLVSDTLYFDKEDFMWRLCGSETALFGIKFTGMTKVPMFRDIGNSFRYTGNFTTVDSSGYGYELSCGYASNDSMYFGTGGNELLHCKVEVESLVFVRYVHVKFSNITSGLVSGAYHIMTAQDLGLFVGRLTPDDSMTVDCRYLTQLPWPERDVYSKVRLYGDTLLLSSNYYATLLLWNASTSSVSDAERSDLAVYPMPFHTTATIRSNSQYMSIRAYSVLGKSIRITTRGFNGGYTVVFEKPPGNCILVFDEGKGKISSRFVVGK